MAKLRFRTRRYGTPDYLEWVDGYSTSEPGLGVCKIGSSWVVIHLRTGKSVGSQGTRAAAMGLAEMLGSCADWTLPGRQLQVHAEMARQCEIHCEIQYGKTRPAKVVADRHVKAYREEMERIDNLPLRNGARNDIYRKPKSFGGLDD